MSEWQRSQQEKVAWPEGLRLKSHHSALFVTDLEWPNYAPHALIGNFLSTTVDIQVAATGPKAIHCLPPDQVFKEIQYTEYIS